MQTTEKIRVLIIDDEQVNRLLLQEMTHAYNPDIEVISVDNAAEGLFHYMRSPFNVVFLDIMMPVIDGNDFLAIIEQNTKAGLLEQSGNIVVQTAIESISQLTALSKWECVQKVIRKPIVAKNMIHCLEKYC